MAYRAKRKVESGCHDKERLIFIEHLLEEAIELNGIQSIFDEHADQDGQFKSLSPVDDEKVNS